MTIFRFKIKEWRSIITIVPVYENRIIACCHSAMQGGFIKPPQIRVAVTSSSYDTSPSV